MQFESGLQNELLRTEEMDRQSKFQAVFEGVAFDANIGSAIFAVGDKVEFVYGTEKFYKLLGYTAEEYENRALLFLRKVHEDTGVYVLRKAVRAAQSEDPEVVSTVETVTKNGIKVLVEVGVKYIERVEEKSYYFVTMKRPKEKGRKYNLQIDNFLKATSTQDNHAMMVVSVGNLDKCAKIYGDRFANTVNMEIYNEIKKSFRVSDHVEQIGNHEFLVFMKKTNERIASRKAEDLSLLISEVYSGESGKLSLYSNIGISYFPYDGADYGTLFVAADSACYYAEQEGENHICAFEESMKSCYKKREEEEFFLLEPKKHGNLDVDIITFAFSLLADTKDIDSTINLLLEQIGNYYDLSSIQVLERNIITDVMENVNIWRRGLGVLAKKDEDSYKSPFTGEEVFLKNQFFSEEGECGDYDDRTIELLKSQNMKSFICSNFDGSIFGNSHIIYSDGKRKRKWSEKEMATLHELARLISSYSSQRKELESAEAEIERLRMRDPLTGLLNRDAFVKEANRIYDMETEGVTYALVYSDMNGFEYVNTSFGKEFGDRLLRNYSNRLAEDKSVMLTCRVYSDCFITLQKGKTPREILDHIKDINRDFLTDLKREHPLNNLSMATGICYVKQMDFDLQTDILHLIENANMARKEAKQKNGSHTIIYDEVLRQKLEREQQVASKMEEAIKKGEIELFLQPKFSLENRKVIGAEALVRWRKPDGTYNLPMEFIPSLEKVGYIIELDFYIYELVLKNMKKWKLEGKHLVPVSVNFSRLHTQSEDFVRQVIRMADYYDVDRNLLEIEITESMLQEDSNRMLNDMDLLQKAGFKVDIDDFGTGYSSLNMLMRAPVDIVKLDKSFLSEVSDSERQRDYLNCIAKLIAAADKEIIFEGVETEQQAKIIADYGYSKVQGFLFGRPIHVREFEQTYMLPEKSAVSNAEVG